MSLATMTRAQLAAYAMEKTGRSVQDLSPEYHWAIKVLDEVEGEIGKELSIFTTTLACYSAALKSSWLKELYMGWPDPQVRAVVLRATKELYGRR